jgi:hypothetical protein
MLQPALAKWLKVFRSLKDSVSGVSVSELAAEISDALAAP